MNPPPASPPPPAVETRSERSARLSNHLHRYLNQVRRHWWMVPLLVIVALGVQAYLIHVTPQAYQSIGRMIVNIKIQMPAGSTTYQEELNNFSGTQVALMQSGTVTNRAIARVQALNPDLQRSRVRLRITVSPKTSIFQLEATGVEPKYTQAYLDACMEEYISLKKEMRTSTSDTTLAGITSELVRLEGDLKKGEAELLAFQSSNSVVFLEEQGNSAGSYLAKLNRLLADLELEHQLLKSLNLDQNLDRQKRPLATVEKDPDESASMTRMLGVEADYLKVRQEIQMLKAEQQDLGEFLRAKHPKMIDMAEKIQQKEKMLEILRGQSMEQLDNRRAAIALQIENMKREVSEWEAKSLEVSKKMAEYQRIRANNTRTQSLYDRLLATMQTIGVDKDINPETVTILERATPARPVRADAAKKLVLSGVVGLVLALGLLMLLDRFDDRPNSFADLQEVFDEPVLCQVPREARLGRNGKIDLLHPDDERHAFRESYRNLRSSLLYMDGEGHRRKTLLVTSSIPSEGKSVTSANLAVTLAQAGARVLLMDADLRKGSLHDRFGFESSPGLSEVLSGQVELVKAIHPSREPNLSVLTRGKTSHNPSELLLNPISQSLLQKLRESYDWIVIDSAPVMAADDVATLAPQVEGVIFVVRANFTSARIARAALDLLYQRNVPILGLAFNAVRSDASDYYYYKYKDYYSTKKS